MATLQSVGVQVTETDLTPVTQPVSASIGAYVGHFNWGPVDELTNVGSETELGKIFGTPSKSNDVNAASFLTAESFLKYGNSLRVIRTIDNNSTGAKNAAGYYDTSGNISEFATLIKNKTAFDNISTNELPAPLYSRYPGELGNSLSVQIFHKDNRSTTSTESKKFFTNLADTTLWASDVAETELVEDEIHIAVYDEKGLISGTKGTVLETWQGLSLHPDARNTNGSNNYWADVINSGSEFIYASQKTVGPGGSPSVQASVEIGADDSKLKFTANLLSFVGADGNNCRVRAINPGTNNASLNASQSGYDLTISLATNSSGFAISTALQIKTFLLDSLFPAILCDLGNGSNGSGVYAPHDYISLTGGVDGFTGLTIASLSTDTTTEVSSYSLSGIGFYSFDGGANGTRDIDNVVNSLSILEDTDNIDVNLIFAEAFIGDDANEINAALISVVENRKDSIAFLSAPLNLYTLSTDSAKLTALKTAKDSFSSTSNTVLSYTVFDSTPVYVYNKYADRYEWVPACGHMAGLCAYTDEISDPWFSPAGFNRGQLRGVTKLAYNPKSIDRDDLYNSNINPIVNVTGQGIILYGDKTGQTRPSAFDRINVRRLFITIQRVCAQAAKFQLFELNDEFTRNAFINTIDPYLRDVQGRRGITDYKVVCNETNNTPQVIDTNRFVADIYIKPARSINYISLNFIATRTGISFTEIGA
jgi:hypothetical protein